MIGFRTKAQAGRFLAQVALMSADRGVDRVDANDLIKPVIRGAIEFCLVK